MKATDDTQLMLRLRKGDEHALRTLMEEHRGWLFRSALGILGDSDAAADAVQETFIKLWLHRRRYNDRYALATWLRAICTRHCLNELRRRKHFQRTPIERTDSSNPQPLEADELQHLLHYAVASLPAKQQVVYRLCELENLSHTEACLATGLSTDQLKANLYTARKSVREKLKQYGIQ